ncbi:MAG: monovalent cation/H+ antiporter subunit D family protein [Rhodospirillaceae bacterium]|jgi:multicomponent Na+:H+ antiporter subunit D|nr:monovalent cation/H+ antiporter subunit D family protein [Rhodospirillaceae bacterium]
MTPSTAVAFSMGVPLVGALLIILQDRYPNIREAITLITASCLVLVVLTILPAVTAGERPGFVAFEMLPGLPIAFQAEPLGMLFALVASGLWLVTSCYSIGYMRSNNEHKQTRFYACFAVALSSTMGVCFSGNMLTLFIFYEVLTLSTYPLVTHSETPEAVKAGRTYLGILIGTSIGFLLLAILWTWSLTGTLDFKPGGILKGKADGPLIGLLLFLYMFGIGKAALMPIHRWLPAAMVAPTPVSALLHAVAVVKAGVFTVVKVIVYIFGVDLLSKTAEAGWLIYVAGATILIASLIALRQDNLKRRLAYSTVSQLSYVIIAAAILTPISIMAAALHIAAHAVGKITLFFAAGSIYTAAHKTEISQMNGIGRRMPWTMSAFGIAALSMIGLPATAGFLSKWYMLEGAAQTNQWFPLTVIVLSTLLNAAYFLPIVYAAFMKPEDPSPDGHTHEHGEASPWIVGSLTLTAAGSLLLFWMPGPAFDLAHQLMEAAR